MYNALFTQGYSANNAVVKPPGFELVRRIYCREIQSVISYYHSRVYAVKSNHLLCRLLLSAGVPLSYELERYMEAAYTRSPYVAKYFKFTSEIEYGRFHSGIFYGPDSQEILLYRETYFDMHEGLKNWRSLSPIQVHLHPESNINLHLLDGRERSTANGLSVVSVDIPMLMLQYRGFIEDQIIRRYNSNGQHQALGESHFVHMYVLPGMLKSHAEIALLNRLMNLHNGAPMSASLVGLPFPIVDYHGRIDAVFKDVLKQLRDKNTSYATYLKNIPAFYEEDMQSVLLMPDVAPTRQVTWAMFLSRLDIMKFLVDIGGARGATYNLNLLHRLKIDIKRMKQDSILNSVLSADLYYDVNRTMDEILAT